MSNNLYILQKDLRLLDNKTLFKASNSKSLMMCYLLPDNFDELSSHRKIFVKESLLSLNADLNKKGQELFLVKSLDQIELSSFDKVFISKSYNFRDQKLENKLEEKVKEAKKEMEVVENSTLYRINDLPFSISDLPDVFTNFRKKIEKSATDFQTIEVPNIPEKYIPEESKTTKVKDYFKSYEFNGDKNDDFNGGEESALDHIKSYLWDKDLARTYKKTRNGMIDFNDSTKLSPWMSLGCISPGTIVNEVREYEEKIEKNESTYWIYFEVLWREYFKFYSLKYGEKIFNLHGLEKKKFELRSDNKDKPKFNEWKEGELDEPFVDANMKELLLTGWMSNRGRQNVASFLAKDLMVDWRWGAEWFEERLIDYDVESNWGNWNYVAGVGVDPRDRKFNVKRQTDMYDQDYEYQDKWLNR